MALQINVHKYQDAAYVVDGIMCSLRMYTQKCIEPNWNISCNDPFSCLFSTDLVQLTMVFHAVTFITSQMSIELNIPFLVRRQHKTDSTVQHSAQCLCSSPSIWFLSSKIYYLFGGTTVHDSVLFESMQNVSWSINYCFYEGKYSLEFSVIDLMIRFTLHMRFGWGGHS